MERENHSSQNETETVPSGLISGVLESLRGKIRQYVLVHGLMLALVWLFASFWVALALDYVPVLLGFAELSQGFRLLLLIIISTGFGFILYRWVFCRVRKQLHFNSLALLLEHRFPELNDALATVVQNPQSETGARHQQMMNEARDHAESTLRECSMADVFNFRPLIVALLMALVLLSSIAWFGISQQSSFLTALRRVYLLDKSQWPRDCHVELVGVKVKYSDPVEGIPEMNSTREFADRNVTVAANANISVLVRAEMPGAETSNASKNRRLPRTCEFIYRTADGQRGKLLMSKVGGARNGYQSYAMEGDILEHVADDIRFYVRADDHTIGPFHILTTSPPVVVRTILDCDYPAYLIDESSSRFTARQIRYSPGIKLPIGTNAVLAIQIDALVDDAFVLGPKGKLVNRARFKDATCLVSLGEISESIDLGIVIKSNGVYTRSTLKFRIGAEEDKPPQVSSRLRGIGTAVTPEARIPVIGEISDKHGVQRTWIELQTPLTDSLTLNQSQQSGTLESEVDLRQLRISGQIPSDLPTKPNCEIIVTVLATDYFDLHGAENVGTGTRHPLEIVTADKLLRILERDEADQRVRLEQIYQEMTDARAYINRARSAKTNQQAGFEPGDEAVPDEPTSNSVEDWDLRQLFIQRALLQTQKSIQEIEGVAFTFDNIRLQLINNRIDAQDRKQRLEQDVAIPLRKIAVESMPALEQFLNDADNIYRQLTDSRTNNSNEHQRWIQQVDEGTLESLAAADGILSEIQSVLDSLLKFETQNELLDLVRRMLEQQQDLKQRTEALRNREAFDDIFNK